MSGTKIQMCHMGRPNEEHLVRQARLSNNNDKVLINVAHHLKNNRFTQCPPNTTNLMPGGCRFMDYGQWDLIDLLHP